MVTQRLATAEDLMALPDDGYRYELYRGEVWRMSPAGGKHGKFAARMAAPLFLLKATNPEVGEVYIADTGFFLESDPQTIFAPDAAFVRAEDLPPEEEQEGYLHVVPTLVIEVVSPTDAPAAVRQKVDAYRQVGVPLIWVASPATRTVLVDGAGRTPVTLTEADVLDGSDVVPGLQPLRVADVFR